MEVAFSAIAMLSFMLYPQVVTVTENVKFSQSALSAAACFKRVLCMFVMYLYVWQPRSYDAFDAFRALHDLFICIRLQVHAYENSIILMQSTLVRFLLYFFFS